MAELVVSRAVEFVRRHTGSLCCLLLLLLPPVRSVLLFFSPLLASTALCALAVLVSRGPSSDKSKQIDDNMKMDEWAAAVRSELDCSKSVCGNAEKLEYSSIQQIMKEPPVFPGEGLKEDAALAAMAERRIEPTQELETDFAKIQGGSEEGTEDIRSWEKPFKQRVHARHDPSQETEQNKALVSLSESEKKMLQRMQRRQAMGNKLAGLEKGLWACDEATEESLGSLSDGAMLTNNRPQNNSVFRLGKALHQQQKSFSPTYEVGGHNTSKLAQVGNVDSLTLEQANLVLAQYA